MSLRQGKFIIIIVILLMIGLGGWFFNKAPLSSYQLKLKQLYKEALASVAQYAVDLPALQMPASDNTAYIELGAACHAKPPEHGAQYLFSHETQDLKQKSRLFVNNEHVYPVWITLYDVDSLDPVISFYIKPGKQSKFQLPVGAYEVEVQSGTAWCNTEKGFEDPVLLEPDTLVNITPNEIEHIRLLAYGSTPSDMMFSNSESVGTTDDNGQKVQGRGSLVLQNVMGSQYAVQGSINQKPVFFLVDTGANVIAVPEGFAKYAGIEGCKKTKYTTANGIIDSCLGSAKEVVVGQFVFKEVDVAYDNGLPEDTFLLGMNILSQFKMVQQGDQMVLSR